MADDTRGKEYEAWEVFPGVKYNTQPWSKNRNVDVTLAVAGTAEDLYLIPSAPLIPTVNLVTNPSFETGAPPTGMTLVGSAISQSAVVARTGSNSILVNPDNLAAGEGFYYTAHRVGSSPESREYLVASVYLNDNAGSGSGARIIIATTAGAALATGNTVALAASWQRSSAALALDTRTAAQYRIYVVTATNHNTNFYADSLQVEIMGQNTPSDYCDGAQGVDYNWEGTAHASFSRRRIGLRVIAGYTLHTTGDIYLAEDQVASSTTGRFIRAGSDFWEDWPLHITERLSIINVNVGETPRVYGVIRGLWVLKQE